MGIVQKMYPFPTLKTARLLLRRAYLTDADDLYRCTGNDKITRYEPWSTHQSNVDTLQFLGSLNEKYDDHTCSEWAIERISDGRVIGMINLHDINDRSLRAELGYWIAEDCWGHGYATEAASAILRYGFSRMRLNRIQAFCHVDNAASMRVLEKVGMRKEGILREYILIHYRMSDVAVYGITFSDYAELK